MGWNADQWAAAGQVSGAVGTFLAAAIAGYTARQSNLAAQSSSNAALTANRALALHNRPNRVELSINVNAGQEPIVDSVGVHETGLDWDVMSQAHFELIWQVPGSRVRRLPIPVGVPLDLSLKDLALLASTGSAGSELQWTFSKFEVRVTTTLGYVWECRSDNAVEREGLMTLTLGEGSNLLYFEAIRPILGA